MYLAVVVGGVDAGFEDVQQRVHQTLAAAQLAPRLLPRRAQVPLTHKHTHSCSERLPPQGGVKPAWKQERRGCVLQSEGTARQLPAPTMHFNDLQRHWD